MDFKASKGGKGSLLTRNKKFKYPEKAIDAGKKYPPALPVTPKKEHVPLDRCGPLVPWGQKYLNLINPCWLLSPPPPQNPGVPMPPSTQVFSKIKHPLASHPPQPASHHPLPVEDGWMGSMPARLFVLGSRGRHCFAFVCWRVWVCNAAPRSRPMNSPSSGAGGGGGRRRADESAAPTRTREGEDGRRGRAGGDPAHWTPKMGIY